MGEHRRVPPLEFELHQGREERCHLAHHTPLVCLTPVGGDGEVHTVGVGFEERDAALAADGRDVGQRLDDADLVVREHHADQRRVGAQCVRHALRIEPAGAGAALRFNVEQR